MRSIPLRLKLVVALVLPMMIVAVLVGERVNTATNDRRVAAAQETEAIQLSGVASFADAIAAEAVAINDVSTTPERLAELRIATDDAIDELRTPEFGLDPLVGEDPLGRPVQSILEAAEAAGLATGLVTTTRLTHATPACFAAHVGKRSDESEIATQMAASGVDVNVPGAVDAWMGGMPVGAHFSLLGGGLLAAVALAPWACVAALRLAAE